MFRFFRQLRQNLLPENRVSKYLLYAIGEILLVVIGILIALQIDNWNEERKVRIEEQVLLRQLKEEYTTNLEQLDSKIATRILLINSSKQLLTYFDNPNPANKDTVISKLANLGLTVTYDPIVNNLVATGKINILQSQQLKTLLTKWSTDVIQVQEVEAIYLNRHQFVYLPVFDKLGLGRATDKALYEKVTTIPTFLMNRHNFVAYDFGQSRMEPDLETILNNRELEGIVSNSIIVNEIINSESFTLRRQIVAILDLLEKQIISEN